MSVDLKARRKELGLSQTEVAQKIGCGCAHYSNIEHNRKKASREVLNKLAKTLGLRYEDLAHLKGKDSPGKDSPGDETWDEPWPEPAPEAITVRPPALNLVPGTVYKLKPKGAVTQGPKIASVAGTNPRDRVQKLRYLETQSGHHIFQSVKGGWLTSYTDVQLLGVYVNE